MYTTEICRVFRGGTWRDFTSYAHTKCWESIPISEVSDFIGIRLVEEVVAQEPTSVAPELSRVVQGGCWYFDDHEVQTVMQLTDDDHDADGIRLVEVIDE